MIDFKAIRNTPVDQLALQLSARGEPNAAYILRQVEGWQKIRHKVPSWAEKDGLVYPHRLALEQCSGETAARYKAAVVERLLGGRARRMVDLTGGMGVDFTFVAPLFDEAVYVERQEELCEAARNNFPLLGLPQAQVVCGDGVEYLRKMPAADLVFIDPARRDSAGRKTVRIEDCEPNLQELLPLLLAKSRFVVAKLSPMLDLTGAVRSLGCVSEAHVVAAGGECKELLLVISSAAQGSGVPLQIYVCDESATLCFSPDEEVAAAPSYAEMPDEWLYEPSAALLKAGAFKLAAVRYGLQKLHPNSHLYTADHEVVDFPGRAFRVVRTLGFGKQDIKALRALTDRANLAVRNFPSTVADLRKKLHLRDGGDFYLFATTAADGKHLLVVCKKIN